jgi:alpha-N-arabinofuranosidase
MRLPGKICGLFLSVALVGALTACRGAKENDSDAPPQLSSQVLVCRVDPGQVGRPIPRDLFGTNLEWVNSADGIMNPGGQIDPGWIQLAREQGVSNVRFPGGTFSDFYHWKDGVGPVGDRPEREHPTDSGRSANGFGTLEYIRFCRSIGASPLITVNAGTAAADEAASWVAYCNRADSAARVADGLPEPAAVGWWEVGNELYLPGNPTDKKIITVSPDVYATRFHDFASAMRKEDPGIRLIAIGTANATSFNLQYPNWSETVLQRDAAEMDAIAVHYYFPLNFGQNGLSVKEVYTSLFAAPEAVNRSLTALDTMISRYERSRHIEIAVTEWGALFSFDPAWVDHVKTMGSAVYLARMMQVFLGQPRVSLADYFKFTDRTMMGWVGYDQRPKIPYYVVQLFSQHFGDRLVAASIDSPTFSTHGAGVVQAEVSVPEVTVVASRAGAGGKLFVNMVNRSWSTIHQIRLDTGAFRGSPSATAWVLTAPRATDSNGRDLPDEVPANMYVEPPRGPSDPQSYQLEKKSVDLSAPILLPPFSVVTLEIDARS